MDLSLYIYNVSPKSSLTGHKLCIVLYMHNGFIVYALCVTHY